MRYFGKLAYRGTSYCGWQRQPGQLGVQQVIEEKLSLLLRESIEVVGCGRTDAGVHASCYYLHFDSGHDLDHGFLRRLNQVLPADIAFSGIQTMPADAHARFDAAQRSYTYHLNFSKDPFLQESSYYFPYPKKPDPASMQEAAALLLDFEEFYPFCRSNNDAKTMTCQLCVSEWEENGEGRLRYKISANRFLRGMVRLIVGMCINVGLQKITLQQVREALEKQERLTRPESAPPEGLLLSLVEYPYPVP